MSVIIRPACQHDIPAMAGLLGDLFAIEADFVANPAAQCQGLALLLSQPQTCVLVAEQDAVVAGMVSIQPLISTAQGGLVGLLEDLVVRADRRGRGLGSRLLRAALQWADNQGMSRVQLVADRNNQPALDFYARQGWARTQLICLRSMSAQ